MNQKGNPILTEMATELFSESKLFQLIDECESYSRIYEQAKEDFLSLGSLDEERKGGMTGRSWLAMNGYENWLKEMDEEDRLRMAGKLQMIADLAEELDEE